MRAPKLYLHNLSALSFQKLKLYQLIQPLLFKLDPEQAHALTMQFWKTFYNWPVMKSIYRPHYTKPVNVANLVFEHPVGLAAGFDKNAEYVSAMAALGFSHVEVGTVTPRPQAGNDKPRLFRLEADKALINRMGFNNHGAEAVAQRLAHLKRPAGLIIGGNIGKNKDTPNAQASADYIYCIEKLFPWVDYFTINVSSPNTPGLRDLLHKGPLTQLLEEVQAKVHLLGGKPVFLKIAPDLTTAQLDDIIATALETNIHGIIATNTTNTRVKLSYPADYIKSIGAGGLSGAPLSDMAYQTLKYLYARSEGAIKIIASGGVMSPADVAKRLNAGASLVQVYTGLIYYGPGIVKDSMRLLVQGQGSLVH